MSLATAWASFRDRGRRIGRRRTRVGVTGPPIPHPPALDAALRDLERLRLETLRMMNQRALWMMPLGIALGAVATWLTASAHDANAVLIGFGLVGAFFGWGLAADPGWHEFRAAYNTRIIPLLTSPPGTLQYEAAHGVRFHHLMELGLLPSANKQHAQDAIAGTYRGVRVRIVEASLERGGKYSTLMFAGLIVELQLPDRFRSTTVITTGDLLTDPMAALARIGQLQRIDLGDTAFTRRYKVYSNDEAEAQALLAPEFAGRMLALAEHSPCAPPRFAIEPGVFWAALPRPEFENLFEPPSMTRPVDGRHGAAELAHSVAFVLRLVDAVLDLAPAALASNADSQMAS